MKKKKIVLLQYVFITVIWIMLYVIHKNYGLCTKIVNEHPGFIIDMFIISMLLPFFYSISSKDEKKMEDEDDTYYKERDYDED